jgi:hypothetical protein
MKDKLRAPLQLSELQLALNDMNVGKSPSPDGIVLEFYREYWQLIGQEYLTVIPRLEISTGDYNWNDSLPTQGRTKTTTNKLEADNAT